MGANAWVVDLKPGFDSKSETLRIILRLSHDNR